MLKQTLSGIIFLLISANTLTAQQKSDLSALDQYRWKNRLVLIFAPAKTNLNFQRQKNAFQGHIKEFKDRDLKVFYLFSDGNSQGDKQQIGDKGIACLYEKFDIKKSIFSIILFGKDGTEKLRTTDLLLTPKLFSVIDAMPMRQREMKSDE